MEQINLQLWAFGISIFAMLTLLVKHVVTIITSDENSERRTFYASATWLVGALLLFVAAVVLSFALNFSLQRGYKISDSIEHWGQMGDFFGGMLNPVLAFASFIALLYTIRVQSKSQEDFIKNSKSDRKMSVISPEYHRLVDSIFEDIDDADGLVAAGLMSSLDKVLFADYGTQPKTIDMLAAEFVRLHSPLDENSGGTYLEYMHAVNRIYRRYERIEKLLREIRSLSGIEILFLEGYSRVAQHLMIRHIMSAHPYLFNNSARIRHIKTLEGNVRIEVDKYLESIGCAKLDTP